MSDDTNDAARPAPIPDHTIHTREDIHGFTERLWEFLSGTRTVLDEAFQDVSIEVATEGVATRSNWRVGGVVRGAYRVMPFGAPTSTRHRALAVGLVLEIENSRAGITHATLDTGRDHLRLDVENPEVIHAVLPLERDAAETVRFFLDAAELPVEIHGPSGRLGTLAPDGQSLVEEPSPPS